MLRKMNYKYFIHHDCSFYPCHDLAEWKSCLFCWCPLYLLDCSGDFTIKQGIKDCSACTIPHTEEGYDFVLESVMAMIYQKANLLQHPMAADDAGLWKNRS